MNDIERQLENDRLDVIREVMDEELKDLEVMNTDEWRRRIEKIYLRQQQTLDKLKI